MKYQRLTREQLEEMHKEFINFLATQTITAAEWQDIKTNRPEVAEQEIDVFSDLVWEGVLNKVDYVEHISKNQLHVFYFGADLMRLITVKVAKDGIDLTSKEGFSWLRENLIDERVTLLQAKKEYSGDPNKDKFVLIQQGAVISKGDLFKYFDKIIS